MNWYSISEASKKYNVSRQAIYSKIKSIEPDNILLAIIGNKKKVSDKLMTTFSKVNVKQVDSLDTTISPVIEAVSNDNELKRLEEHIRDLREQLREKQETIIHLQQQEQQNSITIQQHLQQLQLLTNQLEEVRQENKIVVSKLYQLKDATAKQDEVQKSGQKQFTFLIEICVFVLAVVSILMLVLYVTSK